MNKIVIKLMMAALFSVFLMSCSDYLDLKPLDSFSEETIFSDIALTEAYVNARYIDIKVGFSTNDFAHARGQGLRSICDEAYHTFGDQNAYVFNRGELNPDYTNQYLTWTDYFIAIKNCNIFFESIGKLQGDQRVIDRLIGEVTYIRAFLYADLVSRYGGVPIITNVFGISDDYLTVTRSSYDESVSFILSELEKAANLLPVAHSDANFGRATKGAALALKARVLLYTASPFWNTNNDRNKWQAAADAAKAVIDLTNNSTPAYELDADYKGLFLNNRSKEIIFMRIFNDEMRTNFDRNSSPNGFNGWSQTSVIQNMVDAYEMADGTMPKEDEYAPGNTPWQNRDPRFYASIVCDGQIFRGREIEFWVSSGAGASGIDSNLGIDSWNATKSGYTLRKFMDESILTVNNNTISKQPWIYIRLAEMYLNYAEAMFELGNEDEARKYINLIRNRARAGNPDILPDITVSGQALKEKMQHERRIELAFEDHRFFDVRRWKIAEVTDNLPARRLVIVRNETTLEKTYTIELLQERKFFPQHYLMPISRSELQRAPQIEQNPGYN